jgi:iron-sulfur cluster assembly accessory protein
METLTISEVAATAVLDAITEDEHLRISANSGGCSGWKWALWTEDEMLYTEQDVKFETGYGFDMIVDRDILNDVIGSADIDYTDSKNLVEQGFVFQRKTGIQCGCGESFTPIKEK